MRARAWKMTDDTILALRSAARRGVPIAELCRVFDLSYGYVWKLIRREHWIHLPLTP